MAAAGVRVSCMSDVEAMGSGVHSMSAPLALAVILMGPGSVGAVPATARIWGERPAGPVSRVKEFYPVGEQMGMPLLEGEREGIRCLCLTWAYRDTENRIAGWSVGGAV